MIALIRFFKKIVKDSYTIISNMKIENDIKLDFSDVLFRPKRSTLSSRSEVSLERKFTFKHSKQSWYGVPIISSNMDTISNVDMFKVLSKYKCLTCFHKYIDVNDNVEIRPNLMSPKISLANLNT